MALINAYHAVDERSLSRKIYTSAIATRIRYVYNSI